MASDFTGFNFLSAAMHPVSDAKRGYAMGSLAVPSTTGTASVVGSATSVDTTSHTTSIYMPVPHS